MHYLYDFRMDSNIVWIYIFCKIFIVQFFQLFLILQHENPSKLLMSKKCQLIFLNDAKKSRGNYYLQRLQLTTCYFQRCSQVLKLEGAQLFWAFYPYKKGGGEKGHYLSGMKILEAGPKQTLKLATTPLTSYQRSIKELIGGHKYINSVLRMILTLNIFPTKKIPIFRRRIVL